MTAHRAAFKAFVSCSTLSFPFLRHTEVDFCIAFSLRVSRENLNQDSGECVGITFCYLFANN